MDARLLEDAALQRAHATAAAVGAVVVGAPPRLRFGLARRKALLREGAGCIRLDGLERREQLALQLLEPGARAPLLLVVLVAHRGRRVGGGETLL